MLLGDMVCLTHKISDRLVQNTLFKIAVEQHDCLTLWKPRKRRLKSVYLDRATDEHTIPSAKYDENVVSYYKVAKASPFPSQ